MEKVLDQRGKEDLLKRIPNLRKEQSRTVVYLDESNHTIDVASAVHCSNDLVEVCLRTICSLCDKVNEMPRNFNDSYFPALLLYAETAQQDTSMSEPAIVAQMNSFIPFLRDFLDEITGSIQLFKNLIQQLRVFYSIRNEALPELKSVKLVKAWLFLGEILSYFVKLDEIMLNRPIIKSNFGVYLRTVESLNFNDVAEIQETICTLKELERVLFCGNSFRYACEQSLGELDGNEEFSVEMFDCISEMYTKWEKAADEDIPDKKRLIFIISLAVYYHVHFANFASNKLVKAVFGCHKKLVSILLLDNIMFVPTDFLVREVADVSIFDKKSLVAVQQLLITLQEPKHIDGMLLEATTLNNELKEWMVELEQKIRDKKVTSASFAKNCLLISELFLKGVRQCETMTRLLKTILVSMKTDGKVRKRVAYAVFNMVETTKEVSRHFSTHWPDISEAIGLSEQQWRCHAITLVDGAKQAVKGVSSAKESALTVAIHSLLFTANKSRVTICNVALELADVQSVLKSVDYKQLHYLLLRIGSLCNPRLLAYRSINCSFLTYSKSLIALYWEALLDRKPSIVGIERFCAAVSDCADLSGKSKHIIYSAERNTPRDEFLAENFEFMKKGFLARTCGLVENDLRVITHKHLSIDSRDRLSFEQSNYLVILLANSKLRIYNQIVDVREFVRRYLEKTFYNLTVVAPHDGHSYRQMADVATQKYGIRLNDGLLNGGGIDEVADVIEITRTMPEFVTRHNYCLNFQMFIEKESPNRGLKVLQLDQITASLRKHGLGVLTTAVNVAYQLLCAKMNTFNSLLSEEHVKAQLQKDERYFMDHREELDKKYPMKRAQKLAKLLDASDGQEEGYMNQLRRLVTEIGNTMGLVRSLSVGSKALLSERKEYTDGEEMVQLTDELDLFELEEESEPCRHLRDHLRELRAEHELTSTDFSKALVEVFKEKVRSEWHLQLFYMMVPALTTSHVEHMLTSRQRLHKRAANDREVTFTEDGFGLGVSYLLAVLEAWPRFTALNWFPSAFRSLEEEKAKLSESTAKDARGSHLKMERIAASAKEYRLLLFTFQSSRVFFSVDQWEE